MAYKKKDLEAEMLKVIKEKKIAFLNHCFAYLSFSSATAYNHELEKLESIKEAINKNRVSAKNYMLNKWIGSENPTLQISAYRLLSDSEEHLKLNQSHIDHTTKGESVKEENQPQININLVQPNETKD